MGTFRPSYPMMPESNQSSSSLHFAWFHPGDYLASLRNGLNPFQGTQINIQGSLTIPTQNMIPANETANNIDVEPQPTKPSKRPQISKETSIGPKEPKTKPKTKPKQKPSKKGISKAKGSGLLTSAKREKKNLNFPSYELRSMDASGVLAPFCSCTGVSRQCYRWGAGGWQSSCCTTNISEYPLPMSTTRPGSRTAGRKMSHGAYDKLLRRLAAEGYDLSRPIDLKGHWARHGTNKFVILK